MTVINVETGKPYKVFIGENLLDRLEDFIAPISGAQKLAVITDDIVDGLYYEKIERRLKSSGYDVVKYVFVHGEASKNADNYVSILNFLAREGLSRSDAVVALGGGVVGDIAGFAAATYMRGIKFIQIPTTLLAAVDSSVGGKTAIDLKAGKNLAGAFYQPSAVICDINTLDTLDKDIFRDGCSESIKYGIIGNNSLFSHLFEKGIDFDREYVISECVRMKAEIVSEDEFDKGRRQLLNLGHTFGHAIEAASDYQLSHGCAVAIGMATVARSADANGLCSPQTAESVTEILKKFSLPVSADYDYDSICDIMHSDKKRSGDKVKVVVPEEIGRCSLHPMSSEQLNAFMKAGCL